MTQRSLRQDGVVKRFGETLIADRLGSQAAPGDLFGFFGGNGAGNTISGKPGWQIVSTGALRAAFVAVEVVLLSRMFRASIAALFAILRRPRLRRDCDD